MALPAIVASPFITTGFIFHLARLAGRFLHSLRGVQAFVQLGIGPVIDRFGAKRLTALFLAPQGFGMAVLFLTNSPYGAPAFLILTGVSGAIASTLATALWVDLYGPAQLGRVRSSVEAATVVASGASPIVMGLLIDRGVPLGAQALGCLAYIVLASALASRLAQFPRTAPELQPLS